MASRIHTRQKLYGKVIPLGKILQSRLAVASILSYVDFNESVILLMLGINHQTRAFIKNADGLPGFLIELPFRKAIKSVGFKEAVKFHNSKDLEQILSVKGSVDYKIDQFKLKFPAAAVYVMKSMGWDTELNYLALDKDAAICLFNSRNG